MQVGVARVEKALVERWGFLQRDGTEEESGSRRALPPPQPVSWQCLYGCYVHSSIVPTFHRRCYWLLQVRGAGGWEMD